MLTRTFCGLTSVTLRRLKIYYSSYFCPIFCRVNSRVPEETINNQSAMQLQVIQKYIQKKIITGGCSGCFFSTAARRRASVLAISSIIEAIPPPPPRPRVP